MSQALSNLLHKMTLFLQQVIGFGLLINPEKCSLFLPEVQFLGFLISEHSISMKKDCMEGIVNYIVPSEPRSLKRFLGIITYYSHMIPNLTRYTASLFSAANRNTPNWALTSQELTDFLEVKRRFLRSPAVGFPQLDILHTSPLRVYLDWSRQSISVALTQLQHCPATNATAEILLSCSGRKNPQSLREASSTRGESAALLLATHKYRHFLILAPFLVFTDNLSLFFLQSLRNISGHYHRLFETLSEFSFYLYTLRSSQNSLCDFLSREHMPPMTPEERKLLLDNSTEVPTAFDNISIPHLPPQHSETTSLPSPSIESITPNHHFWQKSPNSRGSCSNTLNHQVTFHPDEKVKNATACNWVQLANATNSNHAEGAISRGSYLVTSISQTTVDSPHTTAPTLPCCSIFNPSHTFTKAETYTKGAILQCPETPLYSTHKFDTVHQIFLDHIPKHGTCSSFLTSRHCDHTKVYYPPIRPVTSMSHHDAQTTLSHHDTISEALCLPTLTNSDLKRIFGSSLDLLSPISRADLLTEQRKDPDLIPLFHFFEHGFPSIRDFHLLYQSERTAFYYSKRNLLFIQSDGVMHMRKTKAESVLPDRPILPINLIYKSLLLSHTTGNSFHKSIQDTYNEINIRFSVYRLQDHVRYFVQSCEFCFLSKKPQPTSQQIPSLYPAFLKAKQASPESIIFTDLTGILPTTKNQNTVICFFFNFFSGHVALFPMRDSTTESVLLALTLYMASHPISHLVSDGASYYTSSRMQTAMTELRIQHSYAPVMNPKSSRTERSIRDAKVLLRVLLSTQSDHSQWDLALGTVQLAINCRVNPDTGLSPQELTTVYIPTSPLSRWIQQPPLESLEPHNQTTDAGSIPDPHTVDNQPPPTRPTQTSDLDSPNLNPPSNHVYTKRRTIGNIPTKILESYRVSHPHKIMSYIHYPKLDMTATLLARTIYAHSIISGKRAAYIRSQAVYSKHSHPLWPLGDHSIGLLVWRYIQKPVAKGFSKSLVSRWCAVWRINYVAGESFCCLESLFTIQGKTVYLDTSIALIWPFNHPNLRLPRDTKTKTISGHSGRVGNGGFGYF